jgi:hypothetical protein
MLRNVGGHDLLVPLGSQVMNTNALVDLNTTGSFIWQLLAESRSADDLVAALVERFAVDGEHAREEVQSFLDDITRMGLLET